MQTDEIERHILRQLKPEMEVIRNKVLAMGCLVEQQIDNALQAFIDGNIRLTEPIIHQGLEVDAYAIVIEKDCMHLLELGRPIALDLTLLMTVIKTIKELERIGNLAEHIARMAICLDDIDKNYRGYYEVRHLAERVKNQLHIALNAFASLNADDISSHLCYDENIDREFISVIRQLATKIMEHTYNVKSAINILWITRAIEQIGYHSLNICRHVTYMTKGMGG